MASKIDIGGKLFSRRVSAKKQNLPFTAVLVEREFASVIAQWPGMVESRVEDVLNDASAKAFKIIKARTPSATGKARSQWFITLPSRFTRFMGNNVIYIRRLEHGWSSRPNAGFMVRSVHKRLPRMIAASAEQFWRFDLRGAEKRAERP